MTFWHCECINRISEAAFTELYRKWCKRKGYHFSDSKAADLYIDSIRHITTLPKNKFLRIYYARVKECLLAAGAQESFER